MRKILCLMPIALLLIAMLYIFDARDHEMSFPRAISLCVWMVCITYASLKIGKLKEDKFE